MQAAMGLLAFVHWQRGADFVGQATPPWAFGYAVRSGQLIPHELGVRVRCITPSVLAAPIASKTTAIATMGQGLRFIGILSVGLVAESFGSCNCILVWKTDLKRTHRCFACCMSRPPRNFAALTELPNRSSA